MAVTDESGEVRRRVGGSAVVGGVARGARVAVARGAGGVAAPPARDLVAEAERQSFGRQTFVKHVFTRLPLVSAFVVTINLFVQVRGNVGLAVAIAQNLTFGAIAVIVLLNLVTYIMVGVMVALMPVTFDRDYNPWIRLISSLVLLLFAIVLVYIASWLLLVILFVVFVVVGVIVRLAHRRRPPLPQLDRTSMTRVLEDPAIPLDTELRSLWADGRAMLRATTHTSLPLTYAESTLAPAPSPRPIAAIADGWNTRSALIRGPQSKSLARLAFAGIVGFVALFGLTVLTQPIRFAPLELVSIQGAAPQPGFVLISSGRGMFVPDPFGQAQFINATDITSISLCDEAPQWWSISIVELLAPGQRSGVDCRPGG